MPNHSRKQEENVRKVAISAARQALREVLTSDEFRLSIAGMIKQGMTDTLTDKLESLGIDTRHPDKTRRDMDHLRTWTELVDHVRKEGFGSFTKWAVLSLLGLIVVGVGAIFARG